MSRLLSFEADRRSINITLNSFNTDLSKERRARLFPSFGRLYPEGNNALARADDVDQVKGVCDGVMEYRAFFEGGTGGGANGHSNGASGGEGGLSLEDRFFRYDVELNKQTFLQQFQYGIFFSFVKLKEQEIRSLTWIAECIAQDAKDRIQGTDFFFSPSSSLILFSLSVSLGAAFLSFFYECSEKKRF